MAILNEHQLEYLNHVLFYSYLSSLFIELTYGKKKMEKEMIERVANAIRDVANIDNRHDATIKTDPMIFAEKYAIAVIRAMREPTDSMRIAAVAHDHSSHVSPLYENIWKAMIDDILSGAEKT